MGEPKNTNMTTLITIALKLALLCQNVSDEMCQRDISQVYVDRGEIWRGILKLEPIFLVQISHVFHATAVVPNNHGRLFLRQHF